MKYTEGPWTAEYDEDGVWVTGPDREAPVICTVENQDARTEGQEDETWANAQLIALAPDHQLFLAALVSGRATLTQASLEEARSRMVWVHVGRKECHTELDPFGCPILSDELRTALEQR